MAKRKGMVSYAYQPKRYKPGYATPPRTPKSVFRTPSKPSAASRAMGYAGEAYNAGKYLATGNYLGAAMDYGPRIARSLFGSKSAARGRGYNTKGSYQGKFKKGKKLLTKTSVYANKGVLLTSEVKGTVSDPDCLYITHTAVDSYKVIIQIVDSLFRKLFEKAGFQISNLDERVGHVSITDAKDWTVELTVQAGLTGTETVATTYQTVAASTVKTVAGQFYVDFLKFSAGYSYNAAGDAGNDIRLYRLILYTQDYNVTYAPTFKCAINLNDEMVHLYGSSEIKIQNRTLSATGDADDTEVSNNPLIGRSYEFKGIPKARDKALWPLNAIPVNGGVQLVRAATLTTNTGYKEPPNPSVFSNCIYSAKIRLEPGNIKTSTIKYQKSMNLIDLLGKINVQWGVTAIHTYHSIFPSEIFCFEDLINVNGAQNISCAYEANQIIGVYCQTKKKALGVVAYTTSDVSNNP